MILTKLIDWKHTHFIRQLKKDRCIKKNIGLSCCGWFDDTARITVHFRILINIRKAVCVPQFNMLRRIFITIIIMVIKTLFNEYSFMNIYERSQINCVVYTVKTIAKCKLMLKVYKLPSVIPVEIVHFSFILVNYSDRLFIKKILR